MERALDLLSWPFRHLPIAISLFALLTVLLGIAYTAAYLNIQQSYQGLRTSEEQTQQLMVDRISLSVDETFENYLTKVANFSQATGNAMQLTGLEGAYRFFLSHGSLNRYMTDNREIVAISIIDGLGRQMTDHQHPSITAEDFGDYIRQGSMTAFQGQTALSPIIHMAGEPAPFVVVTDPVTDAGGTHVAAISAVISLGALLQNVLDQTSARHHVFLCDDRGYLIAHSQATE